MQIVAKIREADAKSKGIDNPNTPSGELMRELIFFILHWKGTGKRLKDLFFEPFFSISTFLGKRFFRLKIPTLNHFSPFYPSQNSRFFELLVPSFRICEYFAGMLFSLVSNFYFTNFKILVYWFTIIKSNQNKVVLTQFTKTNGLFLWFNNLNYESQNRKFCICLTEWIFIRVFFLAYKHM